MKSVVFGCLLVTLVKVTTAQLETVCTVFNSSLSSSGGSPTILADIIYRVSSSAVISGSGSTNPKPVNEDAITQSEVEYRLYVAGNTNQVDAVMFKSIQVINSQPKNPVVKIISKLIYPNTSRLSTVDSVVINADLSNGLWAILGDDFVPGIGTAGFTNFGRTNLIWNHSTNLNVGEEVSMEYRAVPAGEKYDQLPTGKSSYSTYFDFSGGSNVVYSPSAIQVCVDRTSYIYKNVVYQHGFTALSFFMAIVLGMIIVALIVFLVFFIFKKRGYTAMAVSPEEKLKMRETGKKIILDTKGVKKKGFNTIKDYSLIGPDDSIVHILSLKDKLQMFREIDNLDILSTICVDTDIEDQQNEASLESSKLLIEGLRQNQDISTQTQDSVLNNLKANLRSLDKELEEEYNTKMDGVLKDLSVKNKEKIELMLQRQKLEETEVKERTDFLSDVEMNDFLSLLDKQHKTEYNDLTYVLALEQNEEAEKLRKEFSMKKRMGIKQTQQKMVDEVIDKGQLTQQQADWLLKEHRRQQEEIQRLYDEEISQQRMHLKEKLARRRGLAQASETQEDDMKETLNTMAEHQVNDIMKLKKQGKLSSELAQEMIEESKREMLAVKDKMEREKQRQEDELHKKLSLLKQERLNTLRKQQQEEISKYEKVCKEQQTDGPIDPVSVIDAEVKLRSKHRAELSALENELDGDHSKQLEKGRDLLAERTRDELYHLEKNLLDKLRAEGMKDGEVEKILKQHGREVQELREGQEEERERQRNKLMERLSEKKREWEQRKAGERQEQEELREHEAKVISKLINSQMSISAEDREKIMKEHEQNMIKLENSLTLNKIRQKRMLEDRLALKRAQQMDKLQQKQLMEAQKQKMKMMNNGEDEDEDAQRKEVELMKKHAEERLSIMNGQQLNIDDEMEAIRVEMTRERALALKSQEERLGTMIAKLQLDKAKELAKIEEQQKAINNLKLNLVDDLNERGILSTPECEKLLSRHRQEKEDLSRRLDEQRMKQEKSLKKKLAEKVKVKEEALIKQQESDLKTATSVIGGKTAGKLKRMMLMHKQMVELERFRNQMDREIMQTLEETRRQFQLQKLAAIQKQEMDLVSKMVEIGQLKKEELVDVINLLFPHKTPTERSELLRQLYDDVATSKMKSPDHEKLLQSCGPSTLPEKVRRMSISTELDRASSRARPMSRKGSVHSKKKKKLEGRKSSTYSLLDSLDTNTLANGLKKSSKKVAKRNKFDEDDYEQDGRSSRLKQFGNHRNSGRNSADNYRNTDSYSNYSDEDSYRDNLNNKRNKYDQGYDNYGRHYDDEDEDEDGYYSGSFGSKKTAPPPQGRLPPLEPISGSPTRKKKKSKLLKKMAHKRENYDDYS